MMAILPACGPRLSPYGRPSWQLLLLAAPGTKVTLLPECCASAPGFSVFPCCCAHSAVPALLCPPCCATSGPMMAVARSL